MVASVKDAGAAVNQSQAASKSPEASLNQAVEKLAGELQGGEGSNVVASLALPLGMAVEWRGESNSSGGGSSGGGGGGGCGICLAAGRGQNPASLHSLPDC